ncbi:MAG: hypothetical protein Ct9H300mP18_13180 [Candidatus Neomarinimicrobiota bacterium]|nr:MAG: hypothetical protein Ct9H300mP18_13180 [Candidatus Neomarinimicrobiota bacterium]
MAILYLLLGGKKSGKINKMKFSKLNKTTILKGGTILDPVLGKKKKRERLYC